MKDYTDKELDDVLELINFPQGLSFWQAANVGWWENFNPRKFTAFIEAVILGVHPYYAYKDAKQIK